MIAYFLQSWQIFIDNLQDIFSGYGGVLALLFLFAVFLVFYNSINKSKKR